MVPSPVRDRMHIPEYVHDISIAKNSSSIARYCNLAGTRH